MAQRKRPGRMPQTQHGEKLVGSPRNRRDRALRLKPGREHTTRARVPLAGVVGELVGAMSRLLDARMAFRLPILVAGALLVMGRRAAASWFRAASVAEDWDRFYDCLRPVGQHAQSLVLPLAIFVEKRLNPGREGRCKTFLSTSHLVGGVLRDVLFEHSRGNWAAYLSTDTSMSAQEILETVSTCRPTSQDHSINAAKRISGGCTHWSQSR